jgi:hypothetical protein
VTAAWGRAWLFSAGTYCFRDGQIISNYKGGDARIAPQKKRIYYDFSLAGLKFPCVTAAAAQIFCGFPLPETFYDGLGPGGCENVGQFLPENIAKGDDAVAVQAAGNYRAVAEDSKVILQTVAEQV